jgi:hypothetical protein
MFCRVPICRNPDLTSPKSQKAESGPLLAAKKKKDLWHDLGHDLWHDLWHDLG